MREYQESVTSVQTDGQTPDKVISMCCYTSQATKLALNKKTECQEGRKGPARPKRLVTRNTPSNFNYHEKRDYQKSVITGQNDRQMDGWMPNKVIPMCPYASQATQKALPLTCLIVQKL